MNRRRKTEHFERRRGCFAISAKPPSETPPYSNCGGFTLIEVLLSLALLAALMTAMSALVFSLGETWMRDESRFVFLRHARAVSRHLDALLDAASRAAQASHATQGRPEIREVRLPDGTAAVLTFDLAAGDRLFAVGEPSLPEVTCSLAWRRDEGLVLYWQSPLEPRFDPDAWHKVIVSPLVTGLAYDCRDEATGRWTEELRNPDGKGYPQPRRLRLRFARDGREVEECVNLPVSRQEGVAF